MADGMEAGSTECDERRRVRAEADARTKRGLLQLLATTQDGVVFIDRDARIGRFNRSAEAMFGYTADEVLGKNVSLLMPEPHRSRHDEYLERYRRTRHARAIGRIRTVTGLRKSGETFPIEISVTQIDIDDEVQYAAFIRDVSEKARLQQSLVDAERLAVVGQTAAIFAHEVGNPLNNMSLQIQLLQRQLARHGLADSAGERLRLVVAEIHRLAGLLEEFRAMYAREPGESESFDLRRLLEEILEFQARTAGMPTIAFLTEIEDTLPRLTGNRNKLEQVFVNLVKNAIEAMPEGGTLTVRATWSDAGACVEVQDTGVGIPAGVDVFEPFRTSKPNGTGLGLPIVRKIVDAHGGTVSVTSEQDAGATFRVVLPIRDRDRDRAAPATRRRSGARPSSAGSTSRLRR